MEKQKADELITKYLEKIYGFAYKKAYSNDEAQELAAEMTACVYRSLLSADFVYNPDGYVWRICENAYAKYVAAVKKQEGLWIDNLVGVPAPDLFEESNDLEEIYALRREIAFLSSTRREIILSHYYKNEGIKNIANRLGIPEGTVKWHLNRIRKDLKEGISMERHIGNLGLTPVKAAFFSHNGRPGKNGGPEYYLADKLNLNILYSVYWKPKNVQEIAEELGMTPVFIEDKVELLENNGFLVRQKNDRFTTYVNISPRTIKREQTDNVYKMKRKAASRLISDYVPLVRKSVEDFKDIYIPGGNRELFESAVIFYAIRNKCTLDIKDTGYGKYLIKTTDGGEYYAYIFLEQECLDPDYKMTVSGDLSACGNMWRESAKYPICSWAIDTHIDNREGRWQNNLHSDYEYIYEFLTGKISDGPEDEEKMRRMKSRGFLGDDNKIRIMMTRDRTLFDKIPELGADMKDEFAGYALDCAAQEAKEYPSQMQDMIMGNARGFIGGDVAVMVSDMLYSSGTFRPLTEEERITANLILFSDVIP